ncbi:hypothetical protein NEOLEDRAFT_1239998 [Neolentinus lepideus HHB14362 ss-1]|uniref:Uncharacterized protein n=1 Tax=Neolentinus lepideus HHB14362 ss-1 TaxID=1314782 RepID=A0A165UA43_9AGAM|nr:hypothetical protein NEOLEDRAFT_1239998 [Neolentinus lepideus HHB14362 ss-1]
MSTPPNPPPYWYHHYHRGPRFAKRFFWFALGGFATAMWMRNRDANGDFRMQHACMRHKPREQLRAPEAESSPATAGARAWSQEVAHGPMPAPGNATPGWEQENATEIIADMKKKAADTAVELSEATLDTIMSTAMSLKAKLAERTTRLDEENKRLRQELEALKKSPPRLV